MCDQRIAHWSQPLLIQVNDSYKTMEKNNFLGVSNKIASQPLLNQVNDSYFLEAMRNGEAGYERFMSQPLLNQVNYSYLFRLFDQKVDESKNIHKSQPLLNQVNYSYIAFADLL